MKRLEARVDELEAALCFRAWDMPPSVTVDMDPRPPLGEDWKGYL